MEDAQDIDELSYFGEYSINIPSSGSGEYADSTQQGAESLSQINVPPIGPKKFGISRQGDSKSEISDGSVSPINLTTALSNDSTNITNSEGSVTSRTSELQAENPSESNSTQAININLETNPIINGSTESTPSPVNVLDKTSLNTITDASSASAVTNNNFSNSLNNTEVTENVTPTSPTTINNIDSTSSLNSLSNLSKAVGNESKTVINQSPLNTVNNTSLSNSSSSMEIAQEAVSPIPSNAINNIGSTQSSTNIVNTQALLNTINEGKNERETGGFLSKLGNLAKRTGDFLNLSAVSKIGESPINPTTLSQSSLNLEQLNSGEPDKADSIDTFSTSPIKTSNSQSLFITGTQNSMNVEQRQPSVNPEVRIKEIEQKSATPVITSSNVSNTVNSQTSNLPQSVTSNVSQNTQSTNQSESTPQPVTVNIDLNRLIQSISRLEKILISGIDVTIKEI